MSTDLTQKSTWNLDEWRSWPPEAKVRLLAKLRGQSTSRPILPALHASQSLVVAQAKRFNVLVCGRRWGKTTLAIDRLIQPALESFPVAYFSPTYKMLSEVWRELRRALLPHTLRVSVQEHKIELDSGGTVDMWSLDSADSVRGRKYKRVVIDEAAMVRDLENAYQAVIRPTLTDFAGDAWFPSTPKGMGFFKRLYDMGQDPAEPEWASWQIPTSENPHMPPEEIEAARNELPERIFNQEYLAQFLEDGGGVFRRIMEAATAKGQETAIEDHAYVVGVDWGKHEDFTVLTVLDTTTKELVKIDRFNQIDYSVQLSRLETLCGKFNTKTILPERNSIGEPLIEQLQRSGYRVTPFTTSNASKAEAIDALALAFERGDLKIIPDKVLISELQAYDAERLPSGMLRYGAPQGCHDDCVMSLAIAWQAVASPPRRMLVAGPLT